MPPHELPRSDGYANSNAPLTSSGAFLILAGRFSGTFSWQLLSTGLMRIGHQELLGQNDRSFAACPAASAAGCVPLSTVSAHCGALMAPPFAPPMDNGTLVMPWRATACVFC